MRQYDFPFGEQGKIGAVSCTVKALIRRILYPPEGIFFGKYI